MNLTLYTVKSFLVLDASNGSRVLAKYYKNALAEYPGVKEQKQLERALWDKTRKLLNNEIMLYENQVIVYRASVDVILYIIGSVDENEVMLTTALNTLFESMGLVLPRNQVEKKSIIEYMDLAALTLDECIDNGIIIETDPTTIAGRVSRRSADVTDITLGDQSLSDALNKAKEQFLSGVLLK